MGVCWAVGLDWLELAAIRAGEESCRRFRLTCVRGALVCLSVEALKNA